MSQQPASPSPQRHLSRVTVVESPACHFCVDAHEALADLAVDYPLLVDTVDARTDAGQLLMAKHRAAMSPLVLLDGAFFSHGRLPRRKLAKVLNSRHGPGSSGRNDASVAGGGRRG